MSDPSGAVRVRPAARADVPAVLDLWSRARSAAAITPDTPDAVERLLETGPGSLLVAEDEHGAIVGALVAAWDGWRGNMYRLAVDPAHRRRGVALALSRAGERRLRELGARRVTALIAGEETDAEGLWTAAGYARDTNVARWVRDL